MNSGYFFADMISTIIHIMCLCFYLRLLFPNSSELMFRPFLRGVVSLTDPVLLFLKKNNILNKVINPLIPIFLLLVFKSLFADSMQKSLFFLSKISIISAFMAFLSFLYKFYVIIFWFIMSADVFGLYSDIFSLFAIIYNRTLSYISFLKSNSVRNSPFRAFSIIVFIFLIVFSFLSFLLTYFSNIPVVKAESFVFVFSFSIKLLLGNIIGLFELLYFLLLIRIIISWFMPPMTTALLILHAATEPILAPFRKIPLQIGMIDFSPILVFFLYPIVLGFLKEIVNQLP